MLTLATQTFVDGLWILTPEEPSSLALAVAGMGTLAVYAALTYRGVRRPAALSKKQVAVSKKKVSVSKQSHGKQRDNRRRRAA